MKINSFILLWITLAFSGFCSACGTTKNRNLFSQYKKELVSVENLDSEPYGGKRIIRNNRHTVILSLFEEFNDTVIVYFDGKRILKQAIYQENNPSTSNGFSGINLKLLLRKKKEKIVILLSNKKKYAEFIINRKFPLYSIQRYNEKWYINPRLYTIILK